MVRDEEIARLIKYAEGMDTKVRFRSPKESGYSAEWLTDGSEIIIYRTDKTPKIDIVLSLIHELGHHCWYITEKNRVPDFKFDDMLSHREDNGQELTKKMRERILLEESAAAEYWEIIYRDTNCKFPIWKLHAQREVDIWMYEVYHEENAFPTTREYLKKLREAKRKYKEKFNV